MAKIPKTDRRVARQGSGKEIMWIRTCMVCVRQEGVVISFNTIRNKDNARETYEEHMAAHELTGKAPNE